MTTSSADMAAFSNGWRIDSLEPASIESAINPQAFVFGSSPPHGFEPAAPAAQPIHRKKGTKETLMQTAEAHIPTDHANRYLTQLCRHASKMGQQLSGDHAPRSHHAGDAPPPVLHVDWSDTIGAIRFGEGQCILQASNNALLLRVEATTESALRRLQDGIAHRLETFGHREHLTVQWQPSTFQPTGQLEEVPRRVPAPAGPMTVWWRSRLARNLALAAVAAVAIAAHLGLLGATLAAAAWTKWGATAILAFIVLKFIIGVGIHVAGGTLAFRHGKSFLTDRKRRHTPT